MGFYKLIICAENLKLSARALDQLFDEVNSSHLSIKGFSTTMLIFALNKNTAEIRAKKKLENKWKTMNVSDSMKIQVEESVGVNFATGLYHYFPHVTALDHYFGRFPRKGYTFF